MSIISENPALQEKLVSILKRKNLAPEHPLAKFQLPFEPERFPLSPPALFPGYEEYWLEIGSGWGEFTRENARQNPQAFTIALEKKKKRVNRSSQKQKNMELSNIRWMTIDIHWVFENVFAPGSFDRVTINFPDPWPKKKHVKNRFFSDDFLKELSRIVRMKGSLQFATDYWPYLESAAMHLEQSPDWQNRHGGLVVLPGIPGRPVSYFEQLKREEGENIYLLEYEKVAQ